MHGQCKLERLAKDRIVNVWRRSAAADAPVFGVLHGLGACGEDFLPALQTLGPSYGFAIPDFPGHGRSPARETLADLKDLVAIAIAVFSSIDPAKLVLVGHSLGGIIALRAIAEGLLPRAFINIEGNMTGEDCGHVSRSCAGCSYDDFVSQALPKIAAQFSNSALAGDRKIGHRLRDGRVDPRQFHAYCAPIVAASDAGDLLDSFCRLALPRAYVRGEKSLRPKHIETFPAEIEVIEIPNAGHFPFLDDPTAFARILESFAETWHRGGHDQEYAHAH